MPKLSLIESEAARLVGRMPEARRRALQQALLDLCDAHWPEIRGPEPATPLAPALRSIAPPRADLLADPAVSVRPRRINAQFNAVWARALANRGRRCRERRPDHGTDLECICPAGRDPEPPHLRRP